ncbi:MAG TPA: GNAT family N-acetyltransferase [Candidatus Limnocylindrales bacterium]
MNEAARAVPVLEGAQVTLRGLRAGDRPRIREVLADPEVRRWWGYAPLEKDVDDLFDEDAVGFAIEVEGGHVVGWIQYAEEHEPDYRHASIDLALGDGARGRGLGPDAIRTLARYLFEVRGHHRITIDPSAANDRAIRAYESVGFKPVGVMRQYERGPDGTFHDGLLLDLLRDELT